MRNSEWAVRGLSRRFVVAAAAAACLAGVLWVPGVRAGEQGAAAPADPLIQEIRGLRAEIKELAGTSVRTQLLVARLQLQEQRITALSRQQFDTREQLANVQKRRAEVEGAAKMLGVESAAGRTPDGAGDMLSMMRAELAAQVQRESELRAHDADLAAAVAAEQARWVDLNNRLDALERELDRAVR